MTKQRLAIHSKPTNYVSLRATTMLLLILLTLTTPCQALIVRPTGRSVPTPFHTARAATASSDPTAATKPFSANDNNNDINNDDTLDADLQILYRAAQTKSESGDAVIAALTRLEQTMRRRAKTDETVASQLLTALDGDWQLVFTTGTKETEKKFGRLNYFPVKAVQSFRTVQEDPMLIENGIYIGDWAAFKFLGTMTFDLRKRRLSFDFRTVQLFNGGLSFALQAGEAAQWGARSGLGSRRNVENAQRNNLAFFNWISADDKIATARGAGGGLALWKRIG